MKFNVYSLIFQAMYCSEDCLNADWNFAHKGECKKLSHPKTLEPFKLEEFTSPSTESQALHVKSMLVRLIARIGLDNIKKTVLENKPLKPLDLSTQGFQDGTFEAATLDALLLLEDNFEKLKSEESICGLPS
jgi:MYND finger